MNLLKKAQTAKRESKQIEFKQAFDFSDRDWLEKIVRSIVAMANSGGGIIVFGLNRDGNIAGIDVKPILGIDQATITDKVNAYTQSQFSDFEIKPIEKNGTILATILVRGATLPMVFTKEGAYYIPSKKSEGIAFARGTIYFRHGAKSEPGNSDDLREVVERQQQIARKEMLANVQLIAEVQTGSQIKVLPPLVRLSDDPGAMPVRNTNDPSAPTIFRETITVNPNETHKFSRNDLVIRLQELLPENIVFNSYDVFALRKVFDVDKNPNFYFKPKFGSPQYSSEFINWILIRYKEDNGFFSKTRSELKKK
jgi:hypothetical protein